MAAFNGARNTQQLWRRAFLELRESFYRWDGGRCGRCNGGQRNGVKRRRDLEQRHGGFANARVAYLEIRHFGAISDNHDQGVVNHDAGSVWMIEHNYIHHNVSRMALAPL